MDADLVEVAARVLGFDTVAECLAACADDAQMARQFAIMAGAGDTTQRPPKMNARARRHAKRDRERNADPRVARALSAHPGRAHRSTASHWSRTPRVKGPVADVGRYLVVEGPALPGREFPVRIIHPDVLADEQAVIAAERARAYARNGWAH